MNDKPEAVAWLYEIPGANIRYAYAQRRDCFAEGWTETPLYPAPITLHESQVRWRQAFDEMHQRAMKAEAALATPSQDASALVEVCKRILDRGYISSCIEEERDDHDDLVAALSAWEAQHG